MFHHPSQYGVGGVAPPPIHHAPPIKQVQPEIFSIRWKGFIQNVTSTLADSYTSADFTDVVLASEDGLARINCHKVILASASNVLRQLLLNDEQSSVVILPGVSGELLKLITRYIYFGEASVSYLMVEDFVGTSKNLGLKGVVMEPRFERLCGESAALSFLSNAAANYSRMTGHFGGPSTSINNKQESQQAGQPQLSHLPAASPSALVHAAVHAAAHHHHQVQQHQQAPAPPPVPQAPSFPNGLSILAQAASVAKLPVRDRYNFLPSTPARQSVAPGVGLPSSLTPLRKRLPSSESSGTGSYQAASCNDENSPLNQERVVRSSPENAAAINLSVKKEPFQHIADSPSPIDMSVHAAPALATVQPGYSFAIPPPTQIDNVNMFIKQEQMTAVTAAAAAAAAVAANAANAANAAIAAQHQIPATGEKRSMPAKKRRSGKKQMAAAVATGEEATATVSVTGEMSTAQPIPMATGQSASDVHVDNAGDGENTGENTGEIAAGNQVDQAAPSGSNGTEKWKSRQPRPCDHCDRIFSNKFNLKQHVMNMHTPGGTVACEICKKRVKNKWYLRRHQVTHHNAPLKK